MAAYDLVVRHCSEDVLFDGNMLAESGVAAPADWKISVSSWGANWGGMLKK